MNHVYLPEPTDEPPEDDYPEPSLAEQRRQQDEHEYDMERLRDLTR